MKDMLNKINAALQLVKSHLNGEFVYQKYLNHFQKNHPTKKPLDKKTFLQDRQKNKWHGINRCC
jgi:uncharacterized short protein YbdD (DUF466 family)